MNTTQIEAARERLIEMLGATPVIYGTKVSARSGMSHHIGLYCVVEGRIERISYEVALVLGLKHENGCLLKKGGNMDMIFAVIYDLGQILYNNGYHIRKESL